MRNDQVPDESDVAAYLPRGYDSGRVQLLEEESVDRPLGRLEGLELRRRRRGGGLCLVDQAPKPLPRDGVQHQMDALLGPAVLDVVHAERIEDPGLARRHVNGFLPAGEKNPRVGDDRNVDADVGAPIIIDVDVTRDLSARTQPHQAATAPDPANLRHDLRYGRAFQEMLGRRHRAFEPVRYPAAWSHQGNCVVSWDLVWVRHPG